MRGHRRRSDRLDDRAGKLVSVLLALTGCAGAAGGGAGVTAVQTTNPPPTASASPSPTPSPSPAADLAFAVIGDFGTGGADEYSVTGRMCRWRRHHPFDLVVTTGDNVYPDGSPALFDQAFFAPLHCLLDDGVRFRAVLGNHDYGTDSGRPELTEPAFGMKGRNYVVRRKGVRFVLADSNYLNREWLKDAVTAERDDRWTIVVFHHPVYSAGTEHGSTPGFADDLPEMFRRAGVDLVLTGHDHIYFVTRPLRRIRYVVTGGGGAPLYGCGDKWFTDVCRPDHHFLWVRATSQALIVTAVPPSGPPLDRFRTTGR